MGPADSSSDRSFSAAGSALRYTRGLRRICKPDVLIQIYLNGKAFDGDPAAIPLENRLVIAIVIGQPPELIPSDWTFLDP